MLFVLVGDVVGDFVICCFVVGGGVVISSTGRCVVGFGVGSGGGWDPSGLIVVGCITGFIVVGCIIGGWDPSGLIVVGLSSLVVDGHADPHQPSLLHPS